jgi:hypothetical protein
MKMLRFWFAGLTIMGIGHGANIFFPAAAAWNPFAGGERPEWWQILSRLIILAGIIVAPFVVRWLARAVILQDGGFTPKLSGTEQSIAYGDEFAGSSKRLPDQADLSPALKLVFVVAFGLIALALIAWKSQLINAR